MDAFLKGVESVNGAINGVVWGIPMLVLIIGVGLYLTIRSGGFQFAKFGHAMKNTVGKLGKGEKVTDKGAVSPFQALTTALAATVGTGNIAGITAAITLGGPGAVFWVWVSALIGMCTKYAEVVLAVKYRERNEKGDWVGGPMYYITKGLGKNWKWLAVLFCIFGALAAFGIGNAVQVGNITDSINTAIQAFNPAAAGTEGTVNLVLGIVIAIIVALVVLGGIKRIGSVTEKLVPFMAVIYILAALIVVFVNIQNIGPAFASIFKGAFSPEAVTGGIVGITLMNTITWGFKRGVFSNEAGLGSAPIAHAAADTKGPVQQGLWGIFEVFMDTIVICTLTALPLLMSGIPLEYGVKGTTSLNVAAFTPVFGEKISSLIIAVGLTLFALSTILGWALYGTRCVEFLFGSKSIKIYQCIFVLVVIVGATMDLTLAWDISDTLNGLMAIPNLIGVVGLSGVVLKLTKDYKQELKLNKTGKIKA
ncbi:MAG: sodium:alanine symporter family protein [Eubacteriales bacterium]|nr:sodium:alanine symporter family protein [Eubacteriales bacterium]